jgi:hypothetical protein
MQQMLSPHILSVLAVKDFILANLAKGIADGHWLDVRNGGLDFGGNPRKKIICERIGCIVFFFPSSFTTYGLDQAFIQWSPMVGGDVLPDEPMDVMASGTWESPVNLLVGTNTNEGDTFVTGGLNFPLPGPLASAAYDLIFGVDDAKRIRALVSSKALWSGLLCFSCFHPVR